MNNLIKQRAEAIMMSKTIQYTMASLIFAVALFYVYFANVAVRTLTSLERIKDDIQTISIEVSEMESERLLLQNSVNSKLAARLGFVEVENPTFIMKNSNKAALSLKTN